MIAPGFTGSPLDRSEPIRIDPAAEIALAAAPGALLLDLEEYMPRLADGALGWSPLPALAPEERVLLGTIDGIARYARIDPHAKGARRSPELFALLTQLPAGEMATYATARSLLDWHARHRFCANCGAASQPIRAGWARRCPSCGTEHFPRTDPVVIMLAEHGTAAEARVLVGRQPMFDPGRYSALAGFLEVGESIEAAVARELFEEAGVVAGAIRYVASQPWPFPSQLMIACIAQVADDTVKIDHHELEDAMWVTRGEIAAAFNRAEGARFNPPAPHAIASTLLRAWVDGA
ncbi:NAD+ diphosphatase [Sphingomonas vulcanisoli]|uniref:NAD(+) diphosphatase n=1 Tax=Sphingomonas vulcanisoli TaxID=1658060 RepID=A0ABX0TT67_9SPHN|nr:NAD(+) diphosphatase [Sphingomonas vulcanisoli]NIJ08268.1 NAD+ diphosphatase [Sphingomonas vulcanisoli]